MVSNGWDFGVRSADSMEIALPVATNDRVTITGPSYEYIVFYSGATQTSELAHPATTLENSRAKLTVLALLDD